MKLTYSAGREETAMMTQLRRNNEEHRQRETRALHARLQSNTGENNQGQAGNETQVKNKGQQKKSRKPVTGSKVQIIPGEARLSK